MNGNLVSMADLINTAKTTSKLIKLKSDSLFKPSGQLESIIKVFKKIDLDVTKVTSTPSLAHLS